MVRQAVISLSSFSDELQKIAELSEEEKRVAKGVGGGALILGGGKILTSPTTRGDLLGYKRVYHGTSPEAMRSIQQKGLLSQFGGTGQAAIDATIPGREVAQEASRGGVYVSPSKTHARVYALAAGMKKDLGPRELAESIEKKKLSPEGVKSLIRNILPFSESQRKGVVAIDLPRDTWREMWADPLVRKLHEERLPRPIRALTSGGRGTAAIGYFDIDPKYIHGGKGFRQHVIDRLRNLPEHIKRRPGRFGFGVLTAAAGLGALGGGSMLVHKALTEGAKEKSE